MTRATVALSFPFPKKKKTDVRPHTTVQERHQKDAQSRVRRCPEIRGRPSERTTPLVTLKGVKNLGDFTDPAEVEGSDPTVTVADGADDAPNEARTRPVRWSEEVSNYQMMEYLDRAYPTNHAFDGTRRAHAWNHGKQKKSFFTVRYANAEFACLLGRLHTGPEGHTRTQASSEPCRMSYKTTTSSTWRTCTSPVLHQRKQQQKMVQPAGTGSC